MSCAPGMVAIRGKAAGAGLSWCWCNSCFVLMRAGDLNKPSLGLEPDVYASLAAEVDTVVHNGALVNHAYSYQQQFEPNVLGTVEVRALGTGFKVRRRHEPLACCT